MNSALRPLLRAVAFLVLGPLVLWGCGRESGGTPGANGSAEGAEGLETAPVEVIQGTPPGGLQDWVDHVTSALDSMEEEGFQDLESVRSRVVNLYVSRQEYIEMYYGEQGKLNQPADEGLATAVADAEIRFHEMMQLLGEKPAPSTDRIEAKAGEIRDQLAQVLDEARRADVPLTIPGRDESGGGESAAATGGEAPRAVLAGVAETGADDRTGEHRSAEAHTPEIRAILATLDAARQAYHDGAADEALNGVEEAYLEGFEPLEARLPSARVQRVERLFHLSLRPRVARRAPPEQVDESFRAIRAELLTADVALSGGGSFWFGVLNSFAIVLREGLEAVLLLGAILAYLGRLEAGETHRRRVWAGVGVGVLASFATWGVARTLIPIGGANRELLEGVTALLAVCVLVYVSNWLFQKTYIHDWKDYLQRQVGHAVSTGSALVMAGLAFAAVYREGFETVLFYQALMFDVGAGAVLAGFIPGLLVISAVGVGIIRLGLRLPLKQFFLATNTLLIYLAFVFVGKGLYNLQEAGLFAPHPLGWVPDSGALRQLLGVYPVAESLLGQLLLATLVGGTYAYYRSRRAPGAGAASEAPAKTPPEAAAPASSDRQAAPTPEGAGSGAPRSARWRGSPNASASAEVSVSARD